MTSTQGSKKPVIKPKLILPKKCEEDSALLCLLKKCNLQQYYKTLYDKGFDQNLKALVSLSEPELNKVLDSIKFFPGHRSKFINVISGLRKPNSSKKRSYSHRSNSKEQPKRPNSVNKISNSTPRARNIRESEDFSEYTKNLTKELEEAKKRINELTFQLQNKPSYIEKQPAFDPFEALPVIEKKDLELGMSYDSSKMRSTLHYLDIEEICKCLSKMIRKMIVEGTKPKEQSFSPSSAKSGTTNFNSLCEEVPFGVLELFNTHFYDPNSKPGIFPNDDEIYNIAKNIIIRSKMEKECSIICLIYIERLKTMTGIIPNERN